MNNTLDEEILVNPYIRVIPINSNEVLIKHSGQSGYSKLFEDENKSGLMGKVFKFFKKPATINNFLSLYDIEEPDDVIGFIQECKTEHIILKKTDDILNSYYKLLFNYKIDELADLTIGIVGLGILGSRVLSMLTNLGLQNFILIDDREVQNSKIEEKYLHYREVPLGKKYVKIAKDEYSNVLEIYDAFSTEYIEAFVKESDFIIYSQDMLRSNLLHKLNSACIEHNRVWLLSYIDGSECYAGPIFIPGSTACFNEVEIQLDASYPTYARNDYSLYREYVDDIASEDLILTLPHYADTLSGIVCNEVFKYLNSSNTSLSNSVVKIDMENMEFDYINILKYPRCPACKKNSGFKNMFL